MINFINKLGNREKKLVLFSITLLFIFLISLAVINFINGYTLASQNLSKAKSDITTCSIELINISWQRPHCLLIKILLILFLLIAN